MTTEYRDRKGKLIRVDEGTRIEPLPPPAPKDPSPAPAPATETPSSSDAQES